LALVETTASEEVDLLDLKSFGDMSNASSSKRIGGNEEDFEDLLGGGGGGSSASGGGDYLDLDSVESHHKKAFEGAKPPKVGQSGQLLNPIKSGGLQIDYEFIRKPCIYSKK